MKHTLSLNYHARAMAMSLLVLILALGLVWTGQWLKGYSEPKVVVREVSLATPPPPPPPPPSVQQPVVDTPISIQTQGEGPSLAMLDMHQVDINMSKPDAPAVNQDKPQWEHLAINWDAFGLDDLDESPNFLTKPNIALPPSLVRRGIKHAYVELEIVVDEQGRAQLIAVIENPYPELLPGLKNMVRNSRFTAPKKGGIKVRAKFIMPFEIQG